MKKKIIIITILFSIITVYALSNSFSLDTSQLSFAGDSKKNNIKNNFNKDYSLNYSVSNDSTAEKEEIKKISKKTTYLLFGDFNNTNETSEHFYNRKMEFYSSRYSPKIPDKKDDIEDKYHDERMYSNVADFAIPQIFNQVTEYGIIYNSFGDINVEFKDDIAVSIVDLPNVRAKFQSKTDPLKYDYRYYDLKMYYAYYKQDGEWRLWYIYGEDSDDVADYTNNVSALESKQMAVAPSYNSILKNVYNFDKINKLDKSIIDGIYKENKGNIVHINGIYNNYVVTLANGFFIDDGLIVTTWSFLQKSLVDAQYITIINDEKTYNIKGIVTINPDADIAIIKVDKNNDSKVKLGDSSLLKIEDPAIIVSSKYGTGLVTQTGIITASNDYIQTSIPLSNSDEGSPLFNEKGEVVGINTSKSINASVSIAMNSKALTEAYDKFKNIDYDKIETISFEELKEKYFYVKMDDENIKNNIPDKKWKEFSKIGDISNTIKLELLKASYKDGAVSLRYKNNIPQYISSMQLASSFKENLVKDGYKETLNNKTKAIYKSDKYQVVIMDEFGYLIIVMVEL